VSDDRGPALGLILAGGQGARMRPLGAKPFVELGGRPMVAHVLERLAPGLDHVLVSGLPGPEWDWTGCEVVPDRGAAFGGPLVGIASALAVLRARLGSQPFRLVTAPADAPFLPHDLAEQLLRAGGERAAVATYGGSWVPTCALWHPNDLALPDAVAGRSIRSVLEALDAVPVEFPVKREAPGGDPFLNINTPAELALVRLALEDARRSDGSRK